MSGRWAILTGEYPPAPGGVSDYTWQLARSLAQRGEEVHVFAPPAKSPLLIQPGVHVHTLPDHFGPRSLIWLSHEMDALQRPRILVQYVPHAFGMRAMNLPFCVWLYARSARQEIWTMFHEVAYPFRRRQPLRHQVIALVNRMMGALLVMGSTRMFVTIPLWIELLQQLGADGANVVVSPIPSNLPTFASMDATRELRNRLGVGSDLLIGHFGTFSPGIICLLDAIIPDLLAHQNRRFLLIGRGSLKYAESLRRRYSELQDRVLSSGPLSAEDAAVNLSACDLLVQVYPDGMSGRRGTAMAGLALGVPIVSNLGALSETFWADTAAIGLAASPEPTAIREEVERVLADDSVRQHFATRGRALYAERFDIERSVSNLLSEQSP